MLRPKVRMVCMPSSSCSAGPGQSYEKKREQNKTNYFVFFAKCQGLVTCDGGSIVPIYFSINIK